MKDCELCRSPARMFCESDQASLCWDCDEKVHAANFLVAKHSRSLLCLLCQSPTPWTASGRSLGPTVCVCQSCFSLHHPPCSGAGPKEEIRDDGDEYADDDEDDSDDYDDDEDEEEEEEDGENQVVPWSASASSPVAPAASSSSSEEEISSGFSGVGGFLKRMRENSEVDLESDDEIGCSSSQNVGGRSIINEEGSSLGSIRPLKHQRTSENEDQGQVESRSASAINIIESLKKLQREMATNGHNNKPSATILGICRLSRDHSP